VNVFHRFMRPLRHTLAGFAFDHRSHRGHSWFWRHCRSGGGDCEDRVFRRVGAVCHFIAVDRLPRRIRTPAIIICFDPHRARILSARIWVCTIRRRRRRSQNLRLDGSGDHSACIWAVSASEGRPSIFARIDGSGCAFSHSTRATMVGSIPFFFHQARSSPQR